MWKHGKLEKNRAVLARISIDKSIAFTPTLARFVLDHLLLAAMNQLFKHSHCVLFQALIAEFLVLSLSFLFVESKQIWLSMTMLLRLKKRYLAKLHRVTHRGSAEHVSSASFA